MTKTNIAEKYAQIVSEEPSKWHEEAKWRAENQTLLGWSQTIALKILNRIDELHITQKELAKNMGVSPQLINRCVKGKENFNLQTISQLEVALSIQFIQIKGFQIE